MKPISKRTHLMYYLNGALGSGKYDHISLDMVESHVEAGTIFQFLEEQLGTDMTYGLYNPEQLDELLEDFRNGMAAPYHKFKIQENANGLSLLVACLIQALEALE